MTCWNRNETILEYNDSFHAIKSREKKNINACSYTTSNNITTKQDWIVSSDM